MVKCPYFVNLTWNGFMKFKFFVASKVCDAIWADIFGVLFYTVFCDNIFFL